MTTAKERARRYSKASWAGGIAGIILFIVGLLAMALSAWALGAMVAGILVISAIGGGSTGDFERWRWRYIRVLERVAGRRALIPDHARVSELEHEARELDPLEKARKELVWEQVKEIMRADIILGSPFHELDEHAVTTVRAALIAITRVLPEWQTISRPVESDGVSVGVHDKSAAR